MTTTIKDNLPISDFTQSMTPVGIITIRDKDGNILAKTHNMIVTSGREFVFNAFLKAASLNSAIEEKYTEPSGVFHLKFSYIENNVITSPETSFVDIDKTENYKDFALTSSDASISSLNNNNTVGMKITVTLKNDGTGTSDFTKFNQLYIYYVNDTGSVLFSRAILEDTFIGANGSDTIEYCIYF